MEQWWDIATVIAAILASAGVLLGGVHWTVSGAVGPLRAQVGALHDEVSALRAEIHADMRSTGERLARVEEAIGHLASQ